jgi:hypothetical protein
MHVRVIHLRARHVIVMHVVVRHEIEMHAIVMNGSVSRERERNLMVSHFSLRLLTARHGRVVHVRANQVWQ